MSDKYEFMSVSQTVQPITEHHAPERVDNYPDSLVEKAEEGNYEGIKEEALDELTEVLTADNVSDISLDTENVGDTGAARYKNNNIFVDTNPDTSGEPDWVTQSDLQAEGVFEEVNHILAEQIYEEETGEERNKETYWDNAANELLGSIYKWGEEWSFERPLQNADERLRNADEFLTQNLASLTQRAKNDEISFDEYLEGHRELEGRIMNDIVHFVGYRVSQQASEAGEYDPEEVVRMSYDDLRDEFSDEIEQAEDELRDQYGVLVDLDRDIKHDEGFNFFVQTDEGEYKSRGVLEGFEDQGRVFYTWDEEELPERAYN